MPKVKMVPVASLFTFELPEDRNKKVEIVRSLYGYLDRSYFGKYSYQRPGILDEMPYAKPIKSSIIVRREDANVLKAFFVQHKIVFTEHLIFLHAAEAKVLGLTHPSKWQKIVNDLKGSPNLLVTVDF